MLDAPALMTINARGALPDGHPLALSCSPSLPAARRLIAASDVVLAVGCELGPTDFDMYVDGGFHLPGALIRIDIDPEQLCRGRGADLPLLGDAKETLQLLTLQLTDAARQGEERADAARRPAAAEMEPEHAADLAWLHRVRDILPQARWVGDSTRLVYAGNLFYSRAATAGSTPPSASAHWATACPPPSAPRWPNRTGRCSAWPATAASSSPWRKWAPRWKPAPA